METPNPNPTPNPTPTPSPIRPLSPPLSAQPPLVAPPSAVEHRTQRITTVAWLAGVTAVMCLITLGNGASLWSALGVTAVAAMVCGVCAMILREG